MVFTWTTIITTTALVKATDASSRPVGLRNLGNTCYMNAQLQCAYQIPLVRQIVMDEAQADLDNNNNNNDEVAPGLAALASVFADMAQVPAPAAVSPALLARVLGIPVMEQQDTQEFWKLFLPTLQSSRLTDLYTGALEDYIIAQDGSGRERRRAETFLDISLEVPAHAHDDSSSSSSSCCCCSIEDCLAAAFGQAEWLRVAEGNGWRPAKGADKVDALKGSRLQAPGLPCILQLHLKRFTVDWKKNRGNVMEKNNAPVRFDTTLDLRRWCDPHHHEEEWGDKAQSFVLYDLQGVVVHAGEFGMGHYYAYVRPDVTTDRWFRINDHVVEEVSWPEVLADAMGGEVDYAALTGRGEDGDGDAKSTKDDDDDDSDSPRGFWGRLLRRRGRGRGVVAQPYGRYGFGGSTANAYVLQYVKRSEIDRLYYGNDRLL